jgi:hypothetical protein
VRFLLRFRNDAKALPSDRKRLNVLAYQTVQSLGADVGNLRISSSAIELDLLLESDEGLQEATRLLEEKLGPFLTSRKLDVESSPMEKGEAIRQGIVLFDEERYWESHEALESAWLISSGAEKEVLQGLILLAAAFVHLQKGEEGVALSVMQRAYDKLAGHTGSYFELDVAALKAEIQRMLSARNPVFFRIATLR